MCDGAQTVSNMRNPKKRTKHQLESSTYLFNKSRLFIKRLALLNILAVYSNKHHRVMEYIGITHTFDNGTATQRSVGNISAMEALVPDNVAALYSLRLPGHS
jgi:hypothetical protein